MAIEDIVKKVGRSGRLGLLCCWQACFRLKITIQSIHICFSGLVAGASLVWLADGRLHNHLRAKQDKDER